MINISVLVAASFLGGVLVLVAQSTEKCDVNGDCVPCTSIELVRSQSCYSRTVILSFCHQEDSYCKATGYKQVNLHVYFGTFELNRNIDRSINVLKI